MFAWKMTAIAFIFGLCLPCYAADTGGTAVNFRGRVVDKNPCTINNDNQIIVPFGNVLKENADGEKIKKNLNVSVKCTDLNTNDKLKMQITGSSNFSEYILDTSMKDMGIVFYNNDDLIELNTWFNLPDPAESLILTASPVILDKNSTASGDFNATATLLVSIQ
ncbi:fimbrial protein [Pantoea coffeiphila]|uniref:fimbrial protein n=1 Tax=Pantoea coffeiphila TaxID=1465635 RepID=UPI001960BBCF|nr:fimbrial protein [Pantoea coffeiphila]MBM7345420.1 type 1 fimbria pilin [Pantoea coffeiphila]